MKELLALFMIALFPLLSMATGDNYTDCTASDSSGKQWTIKNRYERAARGKAFENCKMNSNNPGSCKTECETFLHGISTRPAWQCTALDADANAWPSNKHPRRDEAIADAKMYCMKKSAIPDSCYLNTDTCRNMNHWP